MGVPASERARGSVGLEPAIIDHIAARVLDPALQLRCSTVATELDGCKDQAHRPDDDADQVRERSDIRRVFEQEKPAQVGRVSESSHRADSPVSICAIYTRQGTNVNGASHTTPKTPFGGRASQNCAQRVFFSTASAIYLRFVGVSRGPALYSSVIRSLSDRLAGLRGVAAIR